MLGSILAIRLDRITKFFLPPRGSLRLSAAKACGSAVPLFWRRSFRGTKVPRFHLPRGPRNLVSINRASALTRGIRLQPRTWLARSWVVM